MQRSKKASCPAAVPHCSRQPSALDKLKLDDPDQQVGVEIVRKAIQAPVRQIAQNAGVDGAVVAGKLLEQKDTNCGFDAQTETYKDLVKAGIVDPTKVVRTALQDAASVAGLLITTEAMIAEKPKKESPMPAGPRYGLAWAAWAVWAAWASKPRQPTFRYGSGPRFRPRPFFVGSCQPQSCQLQA